jgi:hypothetical protein
MFYALNWFVVISLVLLWSLAAWAFHAVAVWTISHAGVLAGSAGAVETLRIPTWLAPWVPPDIAHSLNGMIAAMAPYIEALLAWAPTLAGGLSIAVWTVWGVGCALLVLLGFLVTGLIALLRRRVPAGNSRSGRPA